LDILSILFIGGQKGWYTPLSDPPGKYFLSKYPLAFRALEGTHGDKRPSDEKKGEKE
jgi:hypothetical protein